MLASLQEDSFAEVEDVPLPSSVLPSFSHGELGALQQEDSQLGKIWKRWESGWQPGMAETSTVPGIGGWVREWSRIVDREVYYTGK